MKSMQHTNGSAVETLDPEDWLFLTDLAKTCGLSLPTLIGWAKKIGPNKKPILQAIQMPPQPRGRWMIRRKNWDKFVEWCETGEQPVSSKAERRKEQQRSKSAARKQGYRVK